MSEIEKEWLTTEEAAKYLGIARASVYNYMADLNITTQRFGRDRKGYISLQNVKKMKDYKDYPWKYVGPHNEDVPNAA